MRTLDELLTAYRAGDPAAHEELLTALEGPLRGAVRALIGKGIRSERESMDVCQSILLAFHLQAQDGKVEFETEKALRAYLRTMIRHKLASLAQHMRRAKRGGGAQRLRVDEEGLQLPALDPSASMVAGTAETRRKLEQLLTREEMAILEGRLAGKTNPEIAKALDKTPDAIRMTWSAREKLVREGILQEPEG